MGYIHIYRGSGHYCDACCTQGQWPYEMVRDWPRSKFKIICPNCGHTEVIKPNFWQLINIVREGKGLSMAELARRAGVSRSTIYNLENRITCGNRKTVEKIVEALGANKKLFLKEWEEVRNYNDKRLNAYKEMWNVDSE